MSNLFLGAFNRLYTNYQGYTQRREILAVITNPETKVAKKALDAVNANLNAVQAAYDVARAQKAKYDRAIDLVHDGETIKGYLKIFSAIEASSSSNKFKPNGNVTAQLHQKHLNNLDPKILDKIDPSTKKPLRETFTAFLTSSAKKSSESTTEEAAEPASNKESDPLIKQIQKSLPSKKKESIDQFNDLVAKLEAACFGFAGRYGLFDTNGYNPALSTHQPKEGDLPPLEKYSLIALYEEAVCFLQKITPHYYSRQFHIVPSHDGKTTTAVATDALGSFSSPLRSNSKLQVTQTPPINQRHLQSLAPQSSSASLSTPPTIERKGGKNLLEAFNAAPRPTGRRCRKPTT